ncbi:unnamed protein product [Rotaria sordida]|uniref:Acetohydroxy-acid reductoisomerase n=1 Tax=Rotaria sordida TaxID=392033 RepID=A0A814K649_9BILA|nr:unnamed protein product [Rotaria sordida]
MHIFEKILFCRMPVKIYHDNDADLNIVRSKTVAFIGYGNQGRAQALNLRDSDVKNIIIGNIDDDYAKQARKDGFNPVSIEEAVRQGDILMLLIPDEVQQTVWNEKVRKNVKPNSTLVVASGYNVAFNLLDLPDDMDVVMVAPRMIGAGVRDRYVQNIPYPCFVSVEKDVSGKALATCLSVTCAIGGSRGNGAVSSSCREEAGIDLFAEQAIWPEIMAVFREAYNVLHEAGFSDEAILFDMYISKEPAETFERVADEGLFKQLKHHSQTSQYGQLSTVNRYDGKELREKFQRILHDNILSGKFAEKWSNTKWAAEQLAKEWKEAEKSPLAQADERMDKEKLTTEDNIQRIILGIGITIFLLLIFLLFGKIHVVFFVLLLVISYKLTDYYVLNLNNPEKSFTFWPNLIVFFDTTKNLKEEHLRKQNANCVYIQQNPWVHLMISKQIDTAIDRFCCLCLRDHIYPWLSTITQDDSLVYEAKHVFRYLLATVIRRLHNVDINAFTVERLLPLIFQTCDRYIHTKEIHSSHDSIEFLRKMYKDDLHIAMHNRRQELRYLKNLISNLMPIITPKFIYECKGSRHFLCELFVCQILIDGIDTICQPNTLNRLFYLYFTTAIQRRQMNNIQINITNESNTNVEILSHFITMNGSLHKNKLALELTDVMYEKELMNQFSRVLDRHGSLGLLSIYLTLTDILNDIPIATDILVRKKIYQRLKHIDERYLNPLNSDGYIIISNPYNKNDILIDEIKYLIYHDLEESINNNENEKKSNNFNKSFNIQKTFTLLSRFHCKIYELIEEKYQRNFLTSDEHFFYICGLRMDSPDYRNMKQKNTNENTNPYGGARRYTTTSYQEMEEKDNLHLKCPEDTASISSNSSLDERDLSTWRIHISHAEELRENLTSNSKYCALLIEVQRFDSNNDNDDEKPHWIVARRYQDFYLLEQKLTEFHGIFYDARLPSRRSATTARNLEYLESIKHDFEHFLRHLLSKPTLRNSELLYNFLTQPDDFTLPNGEIILAKMFKVVPRRLRIEKGQSLEPFLISLLNYAEPAKSKATQPSPVFNDIIEEKLQSSTYGNNANINEPFFEPIIEEPVNSCNEELDSAYDHLIFIAKKIFSASPLLIHLLNLFRVPLKNTFDTFFSYIVENRIDDILNDEENIIDVIHALQDTIFPHDADDPGSTDLVNFEDVVAVAEQFMPNVIKLIFGKSNIQNGLQILLQHFQDPLLNKQLFYMILDEILFQLFPELQSHSDASRGNTITETE